MPTPPDLTIIATTWAPEGLVGDARLQSWERSLQSWGSSLIYPGDIYLHIADDGSRCDAKGVPEPIAVGQRRSSFKITTTQQTRRGVGASLNAGFKQAFERSPLVAYFVDDWELEADLDLTPWAQLLMRDKSVGMVRLGPPHPGLTGRIQMFEEGWGLRLNPRAGGYVFSHRPALCHQRMIDAYGWFDEGVSAMECERLYNERFCKRSKPPDIVYALPYPWRHIGDQEVGDITPS